MTQDAHWKRFDGASALAQAGKWQEAIPQFEALLKEEIDSDLHAHLRNDLGVAYQSVGDLDRALEQFRRSWELYDRDKNRLGAAIALGNLGAAHTQRREWDEAIHCFERSLVVFENLKIDNLAVAKLRVDMGDALTASDKPKAACEQYELALKQQEAAGDQHAMALTLHALGTAHRARLRWEDGIAAFERSIALFTELGEQKNLATTLNRLGELHYERRGYEKAIDAYERELKILEALKHERAIAQTLGNLGLACAALRRFEQATECLRRAIAIWEKLGDQHGIAVALWARAQLYFQQDESAKALAEGQRAQALFAGVNSREEEQVRRWLASVRRGKRAGLRRYF